jgi:type IV pilus assembly protein PilW
MIANLRPAIARGPRAMRGFSLIELMIGILLGLIVLAALSSFFVSTSANRHEIERTSRQIENGRYAIESLRNEIHLAGFYAEVQQTAATWQMPDPCATDPATVMASFQLGPPTNIPLPISGYAADGAAPACLLNRKPGTDVLVLRRFNTEMTPVASAVGTQYYFQSSRCQTDSTTKPWTFNLGGNAGDFNLRHVNCAQLTDLYRWRTIAFYIRDWSLSVGDGIPSLVKMDLDCASADAVNCIVTVPLVEGIQDLRLEYGLDTNTDGTPDEYRRCDTTTPCTPNDWAQVTTVRAHVLAVNLEPTVGHKDEKVYDMGSGAPRTVGPFYDQLKRHVYAAVVSAPNRTGPRE